MGKQHLRSPPSRGAWIEISVYCSSVMRPTASPPSRGTWIEILSIIVVDDRAIVAPLTGGVD